MRRRLTAILIATALAALALPAVAAAACGTPQRGKPRGVDSPPLAVGDSVMLGALERLVRAGFEVDARVCRQMGEGVSLLKARNRSRTLPPVVVVALGTNWTVTTRQIRQALRILGRDRILGLVTPRETGGASSSDQRAIRAAGKRWKRRVKVLDWVRLSAGKSAWFAGDGLHLQPAGQRAFTRLLRPALEWPIAEPTVTWKPA
jgi:hypothetical protein